MPRIPGKWSRKKWSRKLHLPTPELAETEALAYVGRRPGDEPTEAEQVLAIVQPSAVHTDTGLARPWEPQPRETAAEYVAFQAWLLSDTACPSHPLARRMAWEQRMVAYKACGEALARSTPEVLAAMSSRCVHMALMWGMSEMAKHASAGATNPQPSSTMKEAMTVVKDAAMLARLLQGLSTANVSVRDGTETEFDLTRLTDDELAQMAVLEAKAKGN